MLIYKRKYDLSNDLTTPPIIVARNGHRGSSTEGQLILTDEIGLMYGRH